jgi:hypothetical protein
LPTVLQELVLVLVLWSLVRLGHKPGMRFLYDVETILLQRLPHMAPVDLILSVWVLGHLRYKVRQNGTRSVLRITPDLGTWSVHARPQLRECGDSFPASVARSCRDGQLAARPT